MLPDFFIIGAAKAGTTALHEYLDQHPEIGMSAVKEPNYFAPVDTAPPGQRYSNVISDRREYEALFVRDVAVRGESSPAYSQWPRRPGVPERIRAEVPAARFIYLVRDPIERIAASYVQRATLAPQPPLAEALGDLSDPANPYVCPSRYMTQVERYLEVFPAERLLVIDQDELRSDRRAVMRRVFEFLGVDPGFWSPALEREHNRTAGKRAYSAAYGRLVHSLIARRLSGSLPPRARAAVRDVAGRALRRPLPEVELAPALRERLAEMLGPEVDGLRRFTGQRFEGWSL